MLSLNKELLELYWKFLFSKERIDKNEIQIVAKLFTYVQMPIKISTHQHNRFKNPQLQKQQSHFFKITNKNSDEELVKSTTLKLMLVEKFLNVNFTTLNINNNYEKLNIRFGATCADNPDKSKAQKHIKALLENAKYIRVIDGYIRKDNNQWSKNKKILQNILPNTYIDIIIQPKPQIENAHKVELKNIFTNSKEIKGEFYNINNTHDRYIETDKLKILLSSGSYHLSTTSNMDFTYLITIKQ